MSNGNQSLSTYIRGNLFIPFYWKYINRSKMLTYFQSLKTYQWLSPEENRRLQGKKLFALVKYAGMHINFYRQIIKKHHLTITQATIFEDIKKFPILTKEIIRDQFDNLYYFKDSNYYCNTSGGSTGEPLIFYQDREYLSWANANKRLFNEWAGRKIGDPMVKIWGSLSDILGSGPGLKGYLRQQVSGVITLGSSRMTDEEMYEHVRRINRIKPRLILAYTNSIEELSRFIKAHHLKVYSPLAVMTAAGVLYPEAKATIEAVFRTRVFNRYGSREVSDMACSCEKDEGLHIVPPLHYIEVVDDRGYPQKPGMSGNIVVTLLSNYTMPLIRYQIGDRGVLSEKNCSCGRGWPLLQEVEGRINSSFRNKFGDFINAGSFYPLFYYIDHIKRFQIIQKEVDLFEVSIVLNDKKKFNEMAKDLKEINWKICKIMKHETTVKYHVVDRIIPSPSGKYIYAFSRLDNSQ